MISHAASMIAAARGCLGTPFHHQGRSPGLGLDCIGLIVIALRAAGLPVHDRTDYPRLPDGHSLTTALTAHGARLVEINYPAPTGGVLRSIGTQPARLNGARRFAPGTPRNEEYNPERFNPATPGDVLLFAFDKRPQHVALLSAPDKIIHAYAPAGKVVETRLNVPWRRRLVSVWRF